jgi:hypothetical protein
LILLAFCVSQPDSWASGEQSNGYPIIVCRTTSARSSWNIFRTECEIQFKFLADGEGFPDIDKQTFGAEIADPAADCAVGCVALDGRVVRNPFGSPTFPRRTISKLGNPLTSLPQSRRLAMPIHPLQFTYSFCKPHPFTGHALIGFVQNAEKQTWRFIAEMLTPESGMSMGTWGETSLAHNPLEIPFY